MPYNGSGTYVPTNPPPFVYNTIISETQMNAAWTDLVNALSQVYVRDGQAALTGNFNMGSQSIVNLAAGTAAAPSVRFTAGNGFYLPATDSVGVATAGVLRFQVSAGGAATFTGTTGANTYTAWSTAGDVKGYVGTDNGGIVTGGSGNNFGIRTAGELILMAGNIDAWRVDTAGHLLNTGGTQPSFSVAGSGIRTSTGTFDAYASTYLNRASAFNASSGVFTAPVGGVYCFHGAASGTVTSGGCAVHIVTAGVESASASIIPTQNAATCSCVFPLSAGQTASLTITITGTTIMTGIHFSGALLY